MFTGNLEHDITDLMCTFVYLAHQCSEIKLSVELIESLAREARIERDQHNLERKMDTLRKTMGYLQDDLQSINMTYTRFKERMEL